MPTVLHWCAGLPTKGRDLLAVGEQGCCIADINPGTTDCLTTSGVQYEHASSLGRGVQRHGESETLMTAGCMLGALQWRKG